MMELKHRDLRGNECAFRAVYLTVSGLSAATLRFLEPTQTSAWLPFHASCGAITGLPCLFCGTTRAMHHLLQGNFAAAVYYNWLAFPLLAAALFAVAIFAAELISDRIFFRIRIRLRFTPKRAAITAAIFVLLWILQVYLAISQHKRELLNPSGPLYALFVN